MKIRILGDRVRLRLTQSEVERVGNGGSVSENTNFPNRIFSYRLVYHSDGELIKSEFAHDIITISVRSDVAIKWANSDEVSIDSGQESKPFILVEKDFKCLTDRGEDESDMFQNPNDSC